jgi:large subunit ribosomal protein L5
MFGLDVCVSLCRPGYRIKYRRRCSREIPKSHRVSGEEAAGFMEKKFGVRVVE